MGSFSWMEYLKDPQLVANFQQYFGIQAQPSYYHSAKSKCNHHQLKLSGGFTSRVSDVKSSSSTNSTFNNDDDDDSFPRTCKICDDYSLKSSQHGDIDDEKDLSKTIIRNKFWYILFSFGTALGDEAFYAFSFCFWFWNVDGSVGRRVVYVWAILMYIGQCLKDIIRWPRPSCPPVVRLERKWELEYGMPSTHAIVGSAVPFSIIFFTSNRYQYPVAVGVFVAILWCALVCSSRIYLGMHTVLDIMAGLGIVVTGLLWVIPLVDWLDPILLEHEYGSLCLCLCTIILIICSPGGDRWTPARGDTAVILGTCVGLNSGAWLNYQLGIIRGPALDPPYLVIWPTYGMIGLSFVRIVIGLCFIAATRASIKTLARYTIQKFILTKDQLSKASATRKQVITELTYKFLTYTTLGFCVVYVVPTIFRYIGIQRPAFHTEV